MGSDREKPEYSLVDSLLVLTKSEVCYFSCLFALLYLEIFLSCLYYVLIHVNRPTSKQMASQTNTDSFPYNHMTNLSL